MRLLHQRLRHLHVLFRPHDLVVQHEPVLAFHDSHWHPQFHRPPGLALRTPARVRLENREHLRFLRDRLASQQAPLHLLDLPLRVVQEVLDFTEDPRIRARPGQLLQRLLRALRDAARLPHVVLHPLRLVLATIAPG